MFSRAVRIQSIVIDNFKNIEHGEIDFTNSRKPYWASVLGLYGQNGSGKTALIKAISILKSALSGGPLPADVCNFVRMGAEFAKLGFQLRLRDVEEPAFFADIFYEFKIGKLESTSKTTMVKPQTDHAPVIFDEKISLVVSKDQKSTRKACWIDTSASDLFGPLAKRKSLLEDKGSKTTKELIVAKLLATATAKSFIFSEELLSSLKSDTNAWDKAQQLQTLPTETELSAMLSDLLKRLAFFGQYELFVIDTTLSGLVSLNALPLHVGLGSIEQGEQSRSILLSLNGQTSIADQAVPFVEKTIDQLNIVLEQIVPGLKIAVEKTGTEYGKNGEVWTNVQLMSLKNSAPIALAYESEGIKKIISVLHLLIRFYNEDSFTVAIDELDSGIFEYLLGQLLSVLAEQGSGQLIFTCHNLRPLETIDKGFIAFTTTDSKNRFIRLTNVKETNNLRDLYVRSILVGENADQLYMTTDNAEMGYAFMLAGQNDDSDQ